MRGTDREFTTTSFGPQGVARKGRYGKIGAYRPDVARIRKHQHLAEVGRPFLLPGAAKAFRIENVASPASELKSVWELLQEIVCMMNEDIHRTQVSRYTDGPVVANDPLWSERELEIAG